MLLLKSKEFVSLIFSCSVLYVPVAHRHGVRILGTVITEWQEGAKICARLLHQDKIVHRFVQQLISIAQYYRFDGWLVNIENPIHVSLLYNMKYACLVMCYC